MPKPDQPSDFFVVGGPVQPDRACYVERAADAELIRGIAEQRFCYVLSARATGKSSLMARAIRTLRREGQLAAVVDLNQIGARGESGDAGRWYYGIAYRILRELRLKVDLQAWWQERSALPAEQRLTEFFWEVVLANTSAPVAVFIDEVERAADLPFAQELFGTIRACYARRVSEPDDARLNFVVLGVGSPGRLCPDANLSPFIDGQPIEPADFTLEQCRTLAPGFRRSDEEAAAILARIHAWTGGQPYLTQKVARGVARRGVGAADVDRVVREQFLAAGAAQKEPYIGHIRGLLTTPGKPTRQALTLLAKIAKGQPVGDEPSSPSRELLRLSGVAALGGDGLLHYRNRIVREVFGERWVGAARPFDWRGAGAAAALIAVAAIVTIWYSQVLPRPYVQTLSVVTQDFAVAEDAYQKLHRLPGFAGTANRLLAEAMARRSRAATTHSEMLSADQVLRQLPDYEPLADRLKAAYWLRRADRARHAERRDDALLFAMQALPGRETAVRRVAAELIGEDYGRLMGTFRFSATPASWSVDWEQGRLAVVDTAHRARRMPFDAQAIEGNEPASPAARVPGRLTALQHVPVTREIGVEELGSAGTFRLQLRVQHPADDDLLLTLAAPSGATVSLPLRRQSPGQEIYSFSATGSSPLVALADEPRQGVWRFTLVDRDPGEVGVLLRWGLQFSEDGDVWLDTPEQGLPIPDPVRTEQVRVEISDDGRRAAASPARAGAVGALTIWDLTTGRAIHDLDLAAPPEHVAFNASASRLLIQVGDRLTLWDVEQGTRVASLETQTAFLLPPALSLDGDFLAIAEQVEGASPLFSLVRAADGELVASAEGVAGARSWLLGPEARYLAVLETPRVVGIVDPRRGRVLRELQHDRDVERVVPVPSNDLLLTADSAGNVRAWALPLDGTRPGEPESWPLGVTVDADSVSVSADGAMAAFEGEHGHVVVRDVSGDLRPLRLRIDRADSVVETGLAPDGRALVTANGKTFRVWRLDPDELAGDENLGMSSAGLSAMALDAAGGVAALGFRGGHVRVRSASELIRRDLAQETVDYIGHRGRVTSLDINVPRSLIASGGDDGVVRAWNLANVAPAAYFMRHPIGPVHAVDTSRDGRYIVSAAEYSARVWSTADGTQHGELSVNGTGLAVAFAPDSRTWAVGDSAGNVFFGAPDSTTPLGSVRAQGGVHAIAFSPDGRVLASGDETGNVELWDTQTYEPVGPRHTFAHPIRWIGFTDSGSHLVVQTIHWVHRVELEGGRLDVVGSRLLDVGLAAGAPPAAPAAERVRVVGGIGAADVTFREIGFDAAADEPLPAGSPLLDRDWSTALGLRINDAGEVVPVSH
ncbi:MAG: AAA-like domain-containing protein [Gammaproteobacteria bacterium]|nr:AAA-like domain-containing protein [Gammaproteobacteria bacterium]